jgi:nitrogen-specific signal transduction histidine kinase
VRLLTNPILIRMAAVFLLAIVAFIVGAIAMRMLRRKLSEDGQMSDGRSAADSLPMQACAVIQQLKQQKFELQAEQQQERRRTKASEHITASIIANLPCGMLFVTPNGLVRQANAAARQLLGFASPLGMSISELFRDATVTTEAGSKLTAAFEAAIQRKSRVNHFAARYVAPGDNQRTLNFTLIPIDDASGEMLGLAAAISDDSAITELRDAQLVHAELSAEMALELRASLAAIRDWAQRMSTKGSTTNQELAADVTAETERLNRVVGGFLLGNGRARAAQA